MFINFIKIWSFDIRNIIKNKDRIITMKKKINGLINIGYELKIILENDEENQEYLLNASYEYNLFKKYFARLLILLMIVHLK